MQTLFGRGVCRRALSLFVVFAYVTGLLFPLASPMGTLAQPLAPQAELVAEYGFEDATTQGWTPRGPATLTVVSDTVRTGDYSLYVTDRTSNWHGANINMLTLMEVGATYEITGCVQLASGSAPTLTIISMNYKPVGGSTSYPWIANATSNDAGWTCLSGSFTYAEEAEELNLNVESLDATTSFYVDDISIVMTDPPPVPVVAVYDYEDATTQGWTPRGPATLTVVSDTVHAGDYSLYVADRTSNWHGANINMLEIMEVGATYEISGCVQLASGTAPTTTIISMNYRPVGGSTSYPWIANATSNDAGWTCFHGSFAYAEEAEELNLNVESLDPTTSFYVDDVTIFMTSAPPVVAQSLVTDFETGTVEGWMPRSGSTAVVTVTDEIAHGGTYSLKTTDRTLNWHAPVLDIRDFMTKGIQYDVAVWTRLLPDEPAADLKVSVELKPTGVATSTYKTVIGGTTVSTDSWTLLEGTYTLDQDVDFLEIYVESSEVTVSFYIDDFSIIYTPKLPIQDIPSVYQAYADDFIVGAALETDGIASDRHSELLLRHFNSVTAANAMKPGPIQPTEGNFNWTNADVVAQYARDNDLYLHGHTLVWHQQAANWMFEDELGDPLESTPENKALVLERLETHIRAVMGRYGDVVNVWDVVNEVIDPAQDDCLRRSRWYELTGSDYISMAFQIAREEAPTATLILNDYGETSEAKRACMYSVVQDMQALGVPIDGIGMQMHINIQYPTVSAIEETIELFSELGEVHITELDMSVYSNDVDSYDTVPEEVLIKQGYRYKAIFEALRRQGQAGEGNLYSVTFWGLADDATWLTTHPIPRINLPLLFDEDLQAKHAYWGIIDPSQLPVFIQEQMVANAAPVVDGVIDSLWTRLPWVEIPATGEISATFQARWDQNYLYLIVDVVDATEDDGDMVEVFVDQNNAKTTSYQGDDRYYTFPSETFQMDYVVVTNTHGYQLEARFPLTATLAPGTRLGFDVRITDGSDPGAPISWNDPTNSQETDTSTFGTLILSNEIKLTTAAEGTPVIDAEEDAVWADATAINTDVWVLGSSGATATVRTLWDSAHLYAYAVVSDNLLSKVSGNAWEQDSIEVFVDQNNAKTSSYESDDGQFRINFDNEVSFRGDAASTDTLTSATRVISGGYVVELAITLTQVLPQDGALVGFDFQVNDDGAGDGVRSSVVVWNDPTGQSYQDTSQLGVLQFVAADNNAPTAEAGADQDVAPDATVTLDGSASSDPDGDALTFGWAQTGGPEVTFTPTLSRTTFTAPSSGVLTFTLTVTDTGGLTDTDETVVTVTSGPSYQIFLPVVLRN